MQNKVITFCYMMLAGIVLAMLVAVNPARLPLLRVCTGVLMTVSASFALYLLRKGKTDSADAVRWQKAVTWILLIVLGLAIGYTRYTSANSVPDTRMGAIAFEGPTARLLKEEGLPDTSLIRVRKTGPIESDASFRISGELQARLPICSDEGVPLMDEQGRWRFRAVTMTHTSDVVTIRGDDPVGTDYVISQPFNRITGLHLVSGPPSGSVALYRISNHIASFVRAGRGTPPVTVLGQVSADPWSFGFKTVLRVTPHYIQNRRDGPYYKVEGGDIRVSMNPDTQNYLLFTKSDAYGYHVVVDGELIPGRPQANPGAFDDQKFLRNHNVFGWMMLFQPRGGPGPIKVVTLDDGAFTRGHPMVEFSLGLRDRMLRVIKQTMPYPNSAFLGAVTLGLRYGLRGTPCLLSDQFGERSREESCHEMIEDEFKHAGVNHVLAVSGLHVTIIAIMFVGIFSILRVPRRMYAPIVVLALIIFAIITGARPSTLRAVIMNSLALLTWAYLGKGLRSSVLLGVAVAAFLILFHNPLMIVDPSFTLSFGAILSLVLLTDPTYALLSRLKGNNLLVFVILLCLLMTAVVVRWNLVTTWRFWAVYLPPAVVLFMAARRLERRNVRLIGRLAYADIPIFIGIFIAAQVSIQVGMMAPLSAAYFCRWASGGAVANLIALPLAGVVIQLGVFAGLLGQIPLVGELLALVLNAANWLYSSAFLWLAHGTTRWFPFPFVAQSSTVFLAFYYILIASYTWHAGVIGRIRTSLASKGVKRLPGVALLAVLIIAVAGAWVTRPRYKPDGDLHVTVPMINYGSCMLVESPGGRRILIDAGYVQHDRGRANEALRTILPFLSHKGIRELDAVIMTSPMVERSAGLAYILKHCRTRAFYSAEPFDSIEAGLPLDDFKDRILPGSAEDYDHAFIDGMYVELIGDPTNPREPSLARILASRGNTFLNRWADDVIARRTLHAGDILFTETHGGVPFYIEVLYPDGGTPDDHPIENRSAVLRIVYGSFSMLITGNLHYSGQEQLVRDYPGTELRSNVMMAPHHGAGFPRRGGVDKDNLLRDLETAYGPLLEQVQPRQVIFDYGNPGPVMKSRTRDTRAVFAQTLRFTQDLLSPDACLVSENDLAIMIDSDGKTYEIHTHAQARGADAGADSVADLEVGF